MITIPIELPEDLAKEILPLQDRLPEIIELGLRQWRKRAALTPRQRTEGVWEAAGIVKPTSDAAVRATTPRKRQRRLVYVAGKATSEVIVESRGDFE